MPDSQDHRALIQKNVLLLIEYLYWVLFSLVALGAFLIVLFITSSPGPAILAFSIPSVICGLLYYPKQLAKETIPLLLAANQPLPKFDFRLDDIEDEANPLELGDRSIQYQ